MCVCVCVCVCVCKEQPKALNHPSGSPPRSSSGALRVQVIQSTPGVEGISHANGSQVQDRINYLWAQENMQEQLKENDDGWRNHR